MFHIINKNKMKFIIAGCGHGTETQECVTDTETGEVVCTNVKPDKHCKTKNKSGTQ